MGYLMELKIGISDGIEFLQLLGLKESQDLIFLILLYLLDYGRSMSSLKEEGRQESNFYLNF